MRRVRKFAGRALAIAVLIATALETRAQAQTDESPFVLDLGAGIDVGINGNVNSGAIGRIQGVSTAILPNSYGDVYGTGINLRVGVGWVLNPESELRGIFTFQSADADLVRLGDIGPSSLYAQYSDYQAFGFDFGYRRYVPIAKPEFRVYGEGTIGIATLDRINVQFAAPQSNIVFATNDFYDQSAAFTWGVSAGVLFRVAEKIDLNAQLGLRGVSGLSEVDQLVGTGLDEINNDSGRLVFPIVLGVRFRF